MNIELPQVKESKGGGCGCGAGGCGCGCNDRAAEAQAAATCDCGPDCTCGCQDGQPCTCGTAASDAAVTASYTVTGMTCGHCVKAVTEEVSAIPGVSGVQVDLASGKLTISSEAPVDFDRIVEACLEAGDYTVA